MHRPPGDKRRPGTISLTSRAPGYEAGKKGGEGIDEGGCSSGRACLPIPAPPRPRVAPTRARPVFSPHSKVFSAVISAHNLAVFTRQAGILRRCSGRSGVPLDATTNPAIETASQRGALPSAIEISPISK
ncbi:hypothetical protein E2C01_072390 [Portunus trituberculatus]|uniref:Uncharacterized protein n=1 Tax=Portunus trituberculatus TaxID=210409 RepID=A0A5B7I2H9_PORTR|nr:hypothetical protein [Portunus trituberculatus]